MHNFPMHVGQSKLAAGMKRGQSFMVQAQKMQDCRLQVVHMNRFIDNIESQLIGGPPCQTSFDSAPRQPHRKGLGMMIPAETAPQGGVRFHHRCPTEFTTPDNKRFIQQPMPRQILHEGR